MRLNPVSDSSSTSSRIRYLGALFSFTMLAVLAAHADSTPRSGTFYGEAQKVGTGTARSYVTVQNGAPVEIGLELSEDALRSLPPGEKWHPGQHPHNYTQYLVPLPAEAEITPIKLLELDWNPGGHEPPGIYDQPHFDFHFYTISLAERDAIDPKDPDYQKKAEHLPADDLIPAGYMTPPPITPFPRMGVHWAHRDAGEFHGKPFTQTLIRGSWQGRMIFYEPMVAKAFLESRPDVTLPIAEAKCYEPTGYHPTTYTIRHDAKNRSYRVSLGGFAHRGCERLKKTASTQQQNTTK